MRDRAAGAKTRERHGLPARSIRLGPGAGGNHFPDAAGYVGGLTAPSKSKLPSAHLQQRPFYLNPPEFALPLPIRANQSDQPYMATRVVFILMLSTDQLLVGRRRAKG
jgi:hypothetical protein